ncbi:hypothetical protein WJX72_005698 [[Myrmecia] bisecta]|uniref:Tim44-like domain-containing protein n=1 Tax=[Myrmecia] bisecta TaxID=41462 RepID=A0AAW1PT65_9CHLO
MAHRLPHLGRALRTGLAQQQQRRCQSSLQEFLKQVKTEIDSNPELKRSVSELRQQAEALKERSRLATDSLSKAAEVAKAAGQQMQQQASQVTSRVQEQAAKASQGMQGAVKSTVESVQGTIKQAGPAAGESVSADQASQQSRSFLARLQSMAATVRDEVAAAVLPQSHTESATKARPVARAPETPAGEGPSALMAVPETRWQKQWRELSEKLSGHPLFRRLSKLTAGNPVVEKGKDVADNLRERWETSDSPLVHRVQDMKDNLFTETEGGLALRELRARDPNFDMVLFLRHVKVDVPVIIRAYLQGKVEVLKEHCTPEMVERLTGIINHQKAQGVIPDATLLDVSDVELVDLKFVEDDPVVVVQFSCQQINCGRDSYGNVVEGGPSEVQRWYYYWALQQDPAGFIGTDGKAYPPRWQLREMMVRGMHHLL